MRLLLLLLLLLVFAAPGRGQDRPGSAPLPREVPLASQQERADTALPAGAELNRSVRLALVREERSPSVGAAQPSMRNFLYQILITAVSALVTALIWKAVF